MTAGGAPGESADLPGFYRRFGPVEGLRVDLMSVDEFLGAPPEFGTLWDTAGTDLLTLEFGDQRTTRLNHDS
jgi:hypothetical protein